MSRRSKILSGLAALLMGSLCHLGGCGLGGLGGSIDGPMRWVIAALNEELWG